MEKKVDIDVNSGLCVIKVTGILKRPQDSHELLRIAGVAAKEHGCTHFLFDIREANIIANTIETFDAAADPEKHGFSRFFRAAAVYPAISDNLRFMENVAVNRGLFALRIFDDIDDAREWLLSN